MRGIKAEISKRNKQCQNKEKRFLKLEGMGSIL